MEQKTIFTFNISGITHLFVNLVRYAFPGKSNERKKAKERGQLGKGKGKGKGQVLVCFRNPIPTSPPHMNSFQQPNQNVIHQYNIHNKPYLIYKYIIFYPNL